MAIRPEYEKAYSTFIVMGIFVLAVNIYYYAYPLWDSMGMTHPVAVKMFLKMRRAGYFASPLYTKGLALMLSLLTVMTRHGRRNSLPWWRISIVAVSGVFLYFFPFGNPAVYTAASAVGYLTVILGASLSLYKLTGFIKKRNDFKETFLQCERRSTRNSPSISRRATSTRASSIRDGSMSSIHSEAQWSLELQARESPSPCICLSWSR